MNEQEQIRLRQLARQSARVNHINFAMVCLSFGESEQDHVRANDEDYGFSTCPHPDCLLVREEIPAEPPDEALEEIADRAALDITLGDIRSRTAVKARVLQAIYETRSSDGDGAVSAEAEIGTAFPHSGEADRCSRGVGAPPIAVAGSIPAESLPSAVSPPLSVVDDPSIDRECEPRDFSDLNEDHDE